MNFHLPPDDISRKALDYYAFLRKEAGQTELAHSAVDAATKLQSDRPPADGLTEEYIDSQILAVAVSQIEPSSDSNLNYVARFEHITLAVIVLTNGYRVVGVNTGGIDRAKFNQQLAEQLAIKDARNKAREVLALRFYDHV